MRAREPVFRPAHGMSSSRRSRARRMRRLGANLIVVLLAIITLLLLVGLFLPRRYYVERAVVIGAEPEQIYADLANLRRWPEWTVWNQTMDPTVQFVFESPDTGVGASYRWTGEKLGEGELTLTRAEATNGVSYRLEFDGGKHLATGSIAMEPEGDSVRVIWSNQGDLGKNPVHRYLGLFVDSMLGRDFERGLSNLKARAEMGRK
jgi:hypothetical protein